MKSLLFATATALALSACAPQGFSAATNAIAAGAQTADEPGTESDMYKEAAPAPANALPLPTTPTTSKLQAESILQGYQYLDPNHVVPTALLEKAVVYFDANKSKLANKNFLSIVDFSKNSAKKRFFIVNMKSGAVGSYYVAHGKGSDPDFDGFAQNFSNSPGSNMSSLGFYRTAEIYSGAHGRSLRMDGLSSTNSNVRSRAIVIHGADYVHNSPSKQGRSNGCFAFPMSQKDDIITMLNGGSLIYAAQSGTK